MKLTLQILTFLALVAVIGVQPAWAYNVKSKARYGEDKFIEVNHHRIHYVEMGEGTPLIMVPGAFSTYRTWNRVIPLLKEHFHLYVLDYIGAGDSAKPKKSFAYTVEEQADIIAAMINKLGFERVNLAGVSYGGCIVLNIAIRYPELVEKIVCIEGSLVKLEHLPPNPFETYLKYPIIGDMFIGLLKTGLFNKTFIKMLTGDWYSQMSPDDRKEVSEFVAMNMRSSHRIAWYKISISYKYGQNYEEEAKSITTPILYLYGGKSGSKEIVDQNITFFQSYLPQIELVKFDDGLHDLQIQKPQEVAEYIREYLKVEE